MLLYYEQKNVKIIKALNFWQQNQKESDNDPDDDDDLL